MKDQKTVYPLKMTAAAMENVYNGTACLDYLSKKQISAVVHQWEARKASKHLYFYLSLSTTNRVRSYRELRDRVIKAKTIDHHIFDLLAASLEKVEKEMKWRACYPVLPDSIYRHKHIRL